jgi:two-component system NarL family sensor kinase
MGKGELTELMAITMIIFMIMPLFLLYYVFIYQNRKKKHIMEQARLKTQFDMELIKSQQEIKEQTLQTIGADMHDNIGQLLSLTSLTLKSIQDATRKNGPASRIGY